MRAKAGPSKSQFKDDFGVGRSPTVQAAFQKGRALTMVGVGDQMAPVPYNTDNEAAHSQMGGQNILEFGAAPFVMGTKGNIYITGQELMKGDFKHTSFMGGENVLSAGTMRCGNGKIKWISATSGHYQPTARHMVTLFEGLRAQQVDLSKVKFYRVRMARAFRARLMASSRNATRWNSTTRGAFRAAILRTCSIHQLRQARVRSQELRTPPNKPAAIASGALSRSPAQSRPGCAKFNRGLGWFLTLRDHRGLTLRESESGQKPSVIPVQSISCWKRWPDYPRLLSLLTIQSRGRVLSIGGLSNEMDNAA